MIDKVIRDLKELIRLGSPKEFFIKWLPYLVIFYLGSIFSNHVRAYVGGDILDKILVAILEIDTMSFVPSLHLSDLTVGFITSGLVKLIVYTKGKNAKKFREGEEYGSARWGTKKDIQPYIDEEFQNNVILTQTEYLTMDSDQRILNMLEIRM